MSTRLSVSRVFWPILSVSGVDCTHFRLNLFWLKVSSIWENLAEEVSRARLTLAFCLLLSEDNTETAFARFTVGTAVVLTGPATQNDTPICWQCHDIVYFQNYRLHLHHNHNFHYHNHLELDAVVCTRMFLLGIVKEKDHVSHCPSVLGLPRQCPFTNLLKDPTEHSSALSNDVEMQTHWGTAHLGMKKYFS